MRVSNNDSLLYVCMCRYMWDYSNKASKPILGGKMPFTVILILEGK